MKIDVAEGKYIVAVSGGVDSIALLDLLSKKAGLLLIVAHFNHGIRTDATEDEKLVEQTAARYGLEFVGGYAYLGPNASEEKAREARYKFLRELKRKYGAKAIITAHHQDDLLETAIVNIFRGTGRRGMSSIADNPEVLRPLLSVPKKDILAYAKEHNLQWRDDPTNTEEKYLRNYVRRRIIPKMSNQQREQLLRDIDKIRVNNQLANQEIAKLSQKTIKNNEIDRQRFTSLPEEIGREVLMRYLRDNDLGSFDKKTVERLSIALKTARPGSTQDVSKGAQLRFTVDRAHLMTGVKA